MSDWDRGPVCLVKPDEGRSFWQPQPTGGWATLKITPATVRQTAGACIVQMVPPGGIIPAHAHLASETIIYVVSGRCEVRVEGESHRLDRDATFVVGQQRLFELENDGDEDLHLMIWLMPSRAEELLSWWGRPRTPGETAPQPFERPDGWEERARLLGVLPAAEAEKIDSSLKGSWRIVSAEATPTWWQPAPSRGYLGRKISLENYPSNAFTAGEQMLCPGAQIVPHAHSHNEEILLVTRGSGHVAGEGREFPIEPGSLVYVGRWVTHSFVNTSDENMHIFAILMPPVRDFWPMIDRLGRRRSPGEEAPYFELTETELEEFTRDYLSGGALATPELAAAHRAAAEEPDLVAQSG